MYSVREYLIVIVCYLTISIKLGYVFSTSIRI